MLNFLVPCPYFFLACWMAHNLVDLCFRLMLILWRKICIWSKDCNYWLVLNLPNMWSMRRARYAMMLSECLFLGLFIDNGHSTWLCWLFRWVEWQQLIPLKELWKKGSETLNLRTISMILWFYASQEGNTEGGSFRGGLRRSSRRRTRSPNDVWFVFSTHPNKTRSVSQTNFY